MDFSRAVSLRNTELGPLITVCAKLGDQNVAKFFAVAKEKQKFSKYAQNVLNTGSRMLSLRPIIQSCYERIFIVNIDYQYFIDQYLKLLMGAIVTPAGFCTYIHPFITFSKTIVLVPYD